MKHRHIKNKPLPEGRLEPGECVLIPSSRLERTVRKWAWTTVACWRPSRQRDKREEVGAILSNEQGFRRKWERIVAVVTDAINQESMSNRTLSGSGFKVADCVCAPGKGHSAPPNRRSR